MSQLPELFYELSWTECAIGGFVGGGAVLFFVLRFKRMGASKWLLLSGALALLTISVSGAVAAVGAAGMGSASALAAFYAHPAGFFLGSLGLVTARFASIPVVLIITAHLLRQRHRRQQRWYRKRCSNCHRIFPAKTQPHAHCPYCGVYWKYER